MLGTAAPRDQREIERFLLDELPSLGPPPRGADGLERARRFFARLGNPQDAARQIHIVGTAGKGTAAAAIVGRLVGAGASVGAHLSPHVYDLRERLLLDGQMPSWHQVQRSLHGMWPAMRAAEAAEGRPPSFFEVMAALAWSIGRDAGVDVFVTEAGIGGELDATNTITRADKVTVIMPVGYDHLEILGNDLASIARTKGAVIAEGGHVVVAPQPHDEVARLLADLATSRDAAVTDIPPLPHAPVPWLAEAAEVANAVLALIASPMGLDVTAVPAPVAIPGRLEQLLVAERTLVLDGAHNPLKLKALGQGLPTAAVLVTALSHEKDLDACAPELAQLAATVIATDFAVAAGDRVVRRSWSAEQLAGAIRSGGARGEVVAIPGIDAAMATALDIAQPGDTIVATGSFMMLAPAREAAMTRVAPLTRTLRPAR